MTNRGQAAAWLKTVGAVTAMTVIYFVAPLRQDDDPLPVAAATAIALVSALLLALLAANRIRGVLQGDLSEGVHGLITVLALAVLGFAMGYFILARSDPSQIAGLNTRLDALYFTLTTLATVGFGDIHPSGQAARGVACVNILFNAVVIASLARTILGVVSRSRAAAHQAKQPGHEHE
jgi:voltage-gated potassium channel